MATRSPAGKSIPEGEPDLLVLRDQIDQEIEERQRIGNELLERQIQHMAGVEQLDADYHTWNEYNEQLLTRRFSTSKVAKAYQFVGFYGFGGVGSLQQELKFVQDCIRQQLRKLESIRSQLELYSYEPSFLAREAYSGSQAVHQGTKLFIVHGHDNATKMELADFLRKVTGDEPIILHQQPDSGRTTIEKFEQIASQARFAIILLTPDDVGHERQAEENRDRARQNVIFEFGYFIGRLGRKNVVALYKEGVELPSDIHGVLYKPLSGNWHTELAKELRAAGVDADLASL